MKKILWSTAAAALFVLTLTGCADNTPVQTEDRPQAAAVISAESTAPVESEIILFSAGDELPVEDGTASGEPTASPEPDTPAPATPPAPQIAAPEDTPASAPAASAPQETQPPVRITVTFEPSEGKSAPETDAGESNSPAPSTTPEPEPTQTSPNQSEPPAVTEPPTTAEPAEPAFSIDHWITYAQNYAKGVGLNLDPTATGCWDNPITADAHCIYLERDIQSRLNRYAKDGTILDVWIWAEPRTDGSYDLYIGYA